MGTSFNSTELLSMDDEQFIATFQGKRIIILENGDTIKEGVVGSFIKTPYASQGSHITHFRFVDESEIRIPFQQANRIVRIVE